MSNTIETTNMIHCSECGALISIDESTTTYCGDIVCPECLEAYFTKCDHCGEYHYDSDITNINGYNYCEDCRDERFAQCERCGEWVRRYYIGTVFTGTNTTEEWCSYCVNNHSTCCSECGRTCSDDEFTFEEYDGDYICNDCYDRLVRGSDINLWKAPHGIQNYSYKPTACFCPAPDPDTIFYGYELEMEAHGCDSKNAAADKLNETLGYTYCKRDGSLSNGLELVSHPATLDYHIGKKAVYESLFAEMIDDGWRSHDDGTCGLHVHISKDAMTSKNRYAVANLLLFFDYHWDKFVIFSRRKEHHLEQWAQRFNTKGIDYSDVAYDAKHYHDRYMTVNLQNAKTVEIRMFRGTLNAETFLATLQMVHVLVTKAIELGTDFDAAKSINWNDLVKSDYEELNAYLEKRKLLNIDNGEPDSIMDEPEDDPFEESDTEFHEGFILGDRVEFRFPGLDCGYNSHLANWEGAVTGTVRSFEDDDANSIGVEFDEGVSEAGLHSLYGRINSNRGQWCRPQDLTIINDAM